MVDGACAGDALVAGVGAVEVKVLAPSVEVPLAGVEDVALPASVQVRQKPEHLSGTLRGRQVEDTHLRLSPAAPQFAHILDISGRTVHSGSPFFASKVYSKR